MYLQYPYALWGLLLIPLVILLRLWRLKPVVITIPSIFIWQKIPETTSEQPLRLRRLILILILQCLGIGTLLLGLSHPVRSTLRPVSQDVILLIDNSASLKTIAPNGRTRWENLTGEISRLLESLNNESRVAIITGSTGFTSVVTEQTPVDALNHLKTLQPTETSADMISLVNQAAGLINRSADRTAVYFCSDQKPPDDLINSLKIKPQLVLQGQPSDNAAITHLALTPNADTGHYDIFMNLHNFSAKMKAGQLVVTADGKEVLVHRVELVPAAKYPLTLAKLDLLAANRTLPAVIEARLIVDDDLKCDNTVWLSRQIKSEQLVCLAGADNPLLLKILQAIPGLKVEYFPEPADVKNDSYDFYIYNNTLPRLHRGWPGSLRPNSKIVLINPAGDFGPFRVKGQQVNPQITYLKPDSPFLSYVDLKPVHIWESRQIEIIPEEQNYFQPLVSSGELPLMGEWRKSDAIGPDTIGASETRIVLISFDLTWRGADSSATDWPLDVSFPIFWSNLINELIAENRSSEEYGYVRTGQPLFFSLKDIGAQTSREIFLKLPDGAEKPLTAINNSVGFTPFQAGIYEIRGGSVSKKIVVNLCDEVESNNHGEILLPETLRSAATEDKIFTVVTHSLAVWLAAAGLILLVAVWWLERQE